MATTEEKNLSIATVTTNLRNVEDCVQDVRGDTNGLIIDIRDAMAVVGLSHAQKAQLRGCMRRVVHALSNASDSLVEFHECAEAMIREEMENDGDIVIQPLGGGGSKPPPDDEIPDDPPPPPPPGGG